jgi:hypothetical protein
MPRVLRFFIGQVPLVVVASATLLKHSIGPARQERVKIGGIGLHIL